MSDEYWDLPADVIRLLQDLDSFLDACPFSDSYFLDCSRRRLPPVDFDHSLAAAGFGLLGLPSLEGGREATYLALAMAAARLGERGFPMGFLLHLLSARDLLAFGSAAQQKEVLRALQQTGPGFCFGITEGEQETLAIHREGQVTLSGSKAYVSNGLIAPFLLLLAREADLPDQPASMYLLSRDTPGLAWMPLSGLDASLRLEQVVLPETALLGRRGHGLAQLAAHMDLERFVITVSCLGLARCAYREAERVVAKKIQKKPQGRWSELGGRLAETRLGLETMELWVRRLATALDACQDVRLTMPLAKLSCAREGFRVADAAMQLVGGVGFAEESLVFRCWKELRGYRIGGGTDEAMAQLAGKQLLKKLTH